MADIQPVYVRTIGHCMGCPPEEGVTTLVDGCCLTHRDYAAYEGGDEPMYDFDD